MSTLYTFGDPLIPYRTEQVYIFVVVGLVNSATKVMGRARMLVTRSSRRTQVLPEGQKGQSVPKGLETGSVTVAGTRPFLVAPVLTCRGAGVACGCLSG